MCDVKCPFCDKPLQPTHRSADEYWCENDDCPDAAWKFGSISLWQEIIRTRKALDIAVGALKEISLHYQNELDKPVDQAKWFSIATDMCDYADNALAEIKTKGSDNG